MNKKKPSEEIEDIINESPESREEFFKLMKESMSHDDLILLALTLMKHQEDVFAEYDSIIETIDICMDQLKNLRQCFSERKKVMGKVIKNSQQHF